MTADPAYLRAVRRSLVPAKYVTCVRELARDRCGRRWLVVSYCPFGGGSPRQRVLTESGEFLVVGTQERAT